MGGRVDRLSDPNAKSPYAFTLDLPAVVDRCRVWFYCILAGDTSTWIPFNGESQNVWAWTMEVDESVSTMIQAALDGDITEWDTGCEEVNDAFLSFW